MTKEELNYLIDEKIRIDKHLLVVYGKDLTAPILEAIAVADRLEQAEQSIPNACDVCLNERGKTCHEVGICSGNIYWTLGYQQALSDIRGDNNG